MILYGRMMSPFARRVAIQAALQGHSLERRDLLVQGEDFERLKQMNPVARIPVLELDDGTLMIESWAMCDWLDETSPSGQRMLPADGLARRDTAQRLAIASGAAEKSVSLVYERNRRPEEYHWMDWQQRLVAQIQGGLKKMDETVPDTGWYGGENIDISDIATVIAWDFLQATNPWVLADGFPRLQAFAERANQMQEFSSTKPVG